DNVGVHAVPDGDREFRVRLESIERRAHHEGVRLADEVRRDVSGVADERRDRAGGREWALGARASWVGIRRYEASAGEDQPDRAGDPLEAIGTCLTEHHVFRIAIVEREAGLVEGRGEPWIADHEHGCPEPLMLKKTGCGKSGCPDG